MHQSASGHGSNLNLPNAITVGRVCLLPFFVHYTVQGRYQLGFTILIVAALGDAFDGLIARLFKMKTVLGAYMDPVADKLTHIVTFATLWYVGIAPLWLVAFVFIRDMVIMTGIITLIALGYPMEMRPTLLGKVTTNVEFVTACLALLTAFVSFPYDKGLVFFCFVASAFMITISFLQYFTVGLGIIKAGKIPEKNKDR